MVTHLDYYAILEIDRLADQATIKRAYRAVAVRCHPDRNPGDRHAEERFKHATEAFSVLSDPEKKRLYDRYGRTTGGSVRDALHPQNFSDLLEELIGSVISQPTPSPASVPGSDLTYELNISLEACAAGDKRTLHLTRNACCTACQGRRALTPTDIAPCKLCQGSGTVENKGFFKQAVSCKQCLGWGHVITKRCFTCKGQGSISQQESFEVQIPAGVEDGAVRTVRGGGNYGPGGYGELHITIRVANHPHFVRQGSDILYELDLSYPTAVLGTQLEVPTLEGPVRLRIPAGTQPGQVFRLRGRGLRTFGGFGKGDQLVTAKITIPRKLDVQQRKTLEQLAETLDNDKNAPEGRGLLRTGLLKSVKNAILRKQ